MSSLDDKLLGEKAHNYCSSSEGEGSDGEGGGEARAANMGVSSHRGTTQTGPKGVIEDWRRYKQLETEKRKEEDLERTILAKKLALTCRTQAEDEKGREEDNDDQLFQELEAEIEEGFLQQYREKRMSEMRQLLTDTPLFGKVVKLTRDTYVEAIDKEDEHVTVMVHLYDNAVLGCETLNGCLHCLAAEYPRVKFCCIKAAETPASNNFVEKGLPALLIYKGGTLIGTFVPLTSQLGEDFYSVDLEGFLQEHSFLPCKEDVEPQAWHSTGQGNQDQDQDSSDSDLVLD